MGLARSACAVLGGILAIAACTTTPVPREYGKFGEFPVDYEMTIANETIQKMVELYAPNKTRLNLRHESPDAFGVKLVSGLRSNGYAISEYAGPGLAMGTERPERMNRDQRADAGVELRYVLDHPDPDLYRVTVLIGAQQLSRAYTTSRGKLLPFGAWVRREK